MITGLEAVRGLQNGNERFVTGNLQHRTLDEYNRAKMTAQQKPFAIILGCSDSRAPAEMVFDQGIGDLFVIRVAGNIVAPSLVGSIEFAVQQFGTPLVVVLGHSQCGAIKACVDTIQSNAGGQHSPNLNSIVERIRPAVQTLAETPLHNDPAALMQHAMRANVRASVANLRYSSPTLEKYVSNNQLLIVGAALDLETGKVDFFEGVPEAGSANIALSE